MDSIELYCIDMYRVRLSLGCVGSYWRLLDRLGLIGLYVN